MKKRIKEVTDTCGVSRFYIQEKFIFWWTHGYPTFASKKEAEASMNYRVEHIVKYH
jgi:hypothetical protein